MYTDIVGSMELTRSLDGERWGVVLDRFLAIAAGAVHAFEGTVNQFTGDGLMAVFGAPLAHEDHARRACLAVLELQREVAALAAELARTRRGRVRRPLRAELRRGDRRLDRRRRAHGLRADRQHDRAGQADRVAGAGGVDGDQRVDRRPGRGRVRAARARRVRAQGRRARASACWSWSGPGRRGRAWRRWPPRAGCRGSSVATRSAPSSSPRSSTRWPATGARSGSSATRAWARAGSCTSSSPAAPRAGWRSTRPPASPTGATSRSCRCWRCTATTSASTSATRPSSPASGSQTTMLALDPAFAADLPLLFEFLGVAGPRAAARAAGSRGAPATGSWRSWRVPSRRAAATRRRCWWSRTCSGSTTRAPRCSRRSLAAVAGTRTLLVGTYRPEYDGGVGCTRRRTASSPRPAGRRRDRRSAHRAARARPLAATGSRR